MVKVSVILPSLNVAKYIGECLNSVVGQSLKDIEILCVDAGSEDGTIEIIKDFVKKDKRVRLILSDQKSYGHQVNMGIDLSNGEYIGIIETDDFISRDMYERLYDYAKTLDADVVKAPYYDFYNKNNKQLCYFYDELNHRIPIGQCFSMKEHGELLAYHPSIWSGIYKRKYLNEKSIRFIEAKGAGYVDVPFRIDACINTDRNAWYDRPLYYYRTTNPLSSSNRFDLETMIERWKQVHSRLKTCKDLYDNYFAKYSITDEYDATLGHVGEMKISEEAYETLIENLSYVDESSIEESDVLRLAAKEKLIAFKNDPYRYYEEAYKFYHIKRFLRLCADQILPRGTRRRKMIKRLLSKKGIL